MSFRLSARSDERLQGVHPDLVKIVRRAIALTAVDFGVTEGRRTLERQRELVAQGKSQTLNSRHLTGHAVDVAAYMNGAVSWDMAHYQQIAAAMKAAAKELGLPIVWGGDWKSLRDGPHFELDRLAYPA